MAGGDFITLVAQTQQQPVAHLIPPVKAVCKDHDRGPSLSVDAEVAGKASDDAGLVEEDRSPSPASSVNQAIGALPRLGERAASERGRHGIQISRGKGQQIARRRGDAAGALHELRERPVGHVLPARDEFGAHHRRARVRAPYTRAIAAQADSPYILAPGVCERMRLQQHVQRLPRPPFEHFA